MLKFSVHRFTPLVITLLSCVSLFALGLNTPCFAQEIGLDDGKHLPQFSTQIGFDGNRSTGNFNQIRMNSRGAIFAKLGETLTVSNQHSYSYMKNGEIKFSDDFRDLAIVNFKPLDLFSPYLLGLYHKSFTRFIDHRWMLGLGGAFSFLRSKANQLKLGVAGSFEWTRLDGRAPPFTPSDDYGKDCLYRSSPMSSRSCDREMWRIIPRIIGHHEWSQGQLIIDYEALWVVDPASLDDERVFMGITVATPITSWLRMYAHYDFSFESIVLVHREKLDTHLTFGLNFNYKSL